MAGSADLCRWKAPLMPGGPGDGREPSPGGHSTAQAHSACPQGRPGQGPVLTAFHLASEEDQCAAGTAQRGREHGRVGERVGFSQRFPVQSKENTRDL